MTIQPLSFVSLMHVGMACSRDGRWMNWDGKRQAIESRRCDMSLLEMEKSQTRAMYRSNVGQIQ